MNYIETKYITLLSARLRNFQKKNDVYNFSCPICNDSKTNKRKARGYILEQHGSIGYYCHNCTTGLSFSEFLKTVAPDLHGPYHFEKFKNIEKRDPIFQTAPPKFADYNMLNKLRKISDLPDDDLIKAFVLSRKIPESFHGKLFACPLFMQWVNSDVIPGKFQYKDLFSDEPRLIIPFMDKNKKIHAFQGRAIRPGGPKYITISLNKEEHILYGRDTVDIRSTIWVLEGPIDSFFIPNSVAVASSNLLVASSILPKENLVLIFDNEKRNEQIVSLMKKAIETNHRIVIFPSTFEYKDINEAIIDGMPPTSIMDIITNNTYQGLKAKLVLTSWRK